MSATLDTRIASALGGGLTSQQLGALITEADEALTTTTSRCDILHRDALDPRHTPVKAKELQAEMANSVFRRDRLSVAVQQLGDLRQETLEAERDAEADRRAAAKAARVKAAVAQWDREYPALANRIAGLAAQLAALGVVPPRIMLPAFADDMSPQGIQAAKNYQRYWPVPVDGYRAPRGYAPSCEGSLIIDPDQALSRLEAA